MSQEDSSSPPKKPKKEKPANLVIPPKKPKLTKAERRALQEAQRAAKTGTSSSNNNKTADPKRSTGTASAASSHPKQQQQPTGSHTTSNTTATTRRASHPPPPSKDPKSVSLFAHLPPFRDPSQHPACFSGATLGRLSSPCTATAGTALTTNAASTEQQQQQQQLFSHLHPAVLTLGLHYAQGTIRGGNARCRAMLHAFSQVLKDYEYTATTSTSSTSIKKDIRVALDHHVLKPAFQYWTTQCRPHSVSMGNAFTFLKRAVASLDRGDTMEVYTNDMLPILLDSMQAYERERLDFAGQAIAKHVQPKIVPSDVILVYGYSEVVHKVLVDQHRQYNHNDDDDNNTPFRVIVVDSRPLLEGRRMLLELRKAGISCSYVLLNALSYVLAQVTKVILGAAALMSDGSVLGRVGTACIATLAAQEHLTLLVCCETYKISNRVQLESVTWNELGNPQHVLKTTNKYNTGKAPKELQDNLRVVNLMYDLTPSQYVSGIVTEMGILPPTSVAVLLREMNPQETDNL